MGFGRRSTKDDRDLLLPSSVYWYSSSVSVATMFSVIFWCFCFGLVAGDLQEVTLPVFTPPSQEVMMTKYFHTPEQSETNRSKKSIASVSDSFYKTLENMKKDLSANISNLQRELNGKNITRDERVNISGAMQDYIRTGVFKNFLSVPIEPTTYKYPTAVWSSQNYEKLRNTQKYRPRNATRIYSPRPVINPAYVPLERAAFFAIPEKPLRRNRGKTKWKDSKNSEVPISDLSPNQDYPKGDFVDRFLEQSLTKYIMSSNLKENVGNVSVKAFSELLKNITDQKPKRLQSPYDENKELRMKFREEVILKKKNETKPHGKFLEKQLQRRLEKVQDVFNEKDKDKILLNMWKYSTLNRTTDSVDEKKPKEINTTEEFIGTTSPVEVIPETTTQLYNASLIYITTAEPEIITKQTTEANRGTIKFYYNKTTTENIGKYNYESSEYGGSNRNLLKLTAEESSYYRKGHFPSLTFIGQPEKPGVIPGRPRIDYPVHSFPPATKFKCPKFKGGKPRMMADPETRCQVFYICTGDGPTTAMLCPNGTMFNENFLVCDWWYNVNC